MSQWTHIIGVIRFNYWAQNCWCSDTQGKPSCWNPESKIDFLKKAFSSQKPRGSEGPIEINVANSKRGPIVTISGDLRDFGLPELKGVISWLNKVHTRINKENAVSEFDDLIMIRDYSIRCDVEYHANFHDAYLSKDKWMLREMPREE